jgi:hypothetical protein
LIRLRKLALVLPALLIASVPVQATINRVQQNDAETVGSTTNAVTFTAAQTAGNLIVVALKFSDNATFVSLSDTKGNTYVQCGNEIDDTIQHVRARIYAAYNIASAAANGNTVTVAVSTVPNDDIRLWINEYAGAAISGANDVNVGTFGVAAGTANDNITSGSATTSVANELLFGFVVPFTGPIIAGTGFTSISTSGGNLVEEQLSNSAGANQATATDQVNGDSYIMMMATFTPASTGSVPNIASLSPTSGAIGSSVTITGTNFGATPGTVRFNGTAVTQPTWSSTNITAQVPTGATTGNVVVTLGGIASNGVKFTIVTPINRVQQNDAETVGSTTNSATFTGAQTAGNLIVVALKFSDNATFVSLSDTKGNTYVQCGNEIDYTTEQVRARIYAAYNIASAAANGNTVTLTVSTVPNDDIRLWINEYSGAAISGANDVNAATFGAAAGTASDNITSGTATTSVANELLFGFLRPFSGPGIAGTGFRSISTSGGNLIEEQLSNSAGANQATATDHVSGDLYIMMMATFKPAGGGNGAPSITSLSPTSGAIGTSVTITGTNFGATQGSSTVTFNGTTATPTYWSATTIVVTVPSGATTGNVVVTASNVASNSLPFTVILTPGISSLSTTSGPVGTPLTITGTNFGGTQGSSAVTFNGTLATPPTWNNASISVSVPVTATTGSVVVTVGGQQSNPINFNVTVPTPSISGLSSSSGPVGAMVTITGTNFGASQLSSTVSFNGAQAFASAWSLTQIVAQVPTGATTGPLVVTASGQTSNGIAFTVSTPPPSIASISPTAGGVGSRVMLTGTHFGPTQGQGTVTVGSAQATVAVWSDTSLTVIVPTGLNLGTIAVAANVAGVASNSVQFTITQPLVLSPNAMTLLLGSSQALQFSDENGVPLTGVSFSVADSTIAEIDAPAITGAPTTIRGLGVGTTTVIATVGSRSGQAQVTVVAGSSLPAGTTAWTIAPSNGGSFTRGVRSVIVDNNTPAFYLEDDTAYGLNTDGDSNGGAIRGFTSDGQPKWLWPTGPSNRFPQILAADSQGGVIYWATTDTFGRYLGKLDESGNEVWQHTTNTFQTSVVIHPDGTIFLVDSNAGQSAVIALNPATGQVKFTVPLPVLSQFLNLDDTLVQVTSNPATFELRCTPGSSGTSTAQASNGPLTVDAQGNVYLPLGSASDVLDGEPCTPTVPPTALNTSNSSWSHTGVLSLMTIHSDGSSTIQTIDTQSTSGTNWANRSNYFDAPGTRAVPDGQGGVLLPYANVVYHVTNAGIQALSLPLYAARTGIFSNWDDKVLVGETGNAYLYGFPNSAAPIPSIVAFDSGTGSVTWSLSLSSSADVNMDAVLTDGSLVFEQGSGIFIASPTGQVSPFFSGATTLPTLASSPSAQAVYQGDGFWGMPLADGTFASIQGPTTDPADSYSEAGGDETRQVKEPTGAKFNSDPNPSNAVSSACSGLDDTRALKNRWLLVPVAGNNTAQVKLNHGWKNVSLQSLDSTVATVSPSTATNNTIITVTGVKVGVVGIQATNSDDPTAPPALLEATVKPLLQRSLDIVKVIDNVNNLVPQNVPDAATLGTFLNQVWGKQANVNFTPVNRHADVTVHWDLLPQPNGNGVMDDFATYGTQAGNLTERNAIINTTAIPDLDPSLTHNYAFYINQFGPPRGQTCEPGHACSSILGSSDHPGRFSLLSGIAVGSLQKTVAGHEIGHTLGSPDWSVGSSDDVMHQSSTGNCRVRQRDWQLVNPTTGDPLP